jgi:hypothetical protein
VQHTPQLSSPTAVAAPRIRLSQYFALVMYPFRKLRRSRRTLALTRHRERLQASRLQDKFFTELGG